MQVTAVAASSRWQRVAVNVFKVTFPIGFIVMKHFLFEMQQCSVFLLIITIMPDLFPSQILL